jgi:hypothetical protein
MQTRKQEELRAMIIQNTPWEETQRVKRREQALKAVIGALSTHDVDLVLGAIERGEVTLKVENGKLRATTQTVSLHLNYEGAWLYKKGKHPGSHGVSGFVLPLQCPVDAAKRLALEWFGLLLPTARVHINRGDESGLDARDIFGPGEGIELIGVHHRRSAYLTEYEYREASKHPKFEWDYEGEAGFNLL